MKAMNAMKTTTRARGLRRALIVLGLSAAALAAVGAAVVALNLHGEDALPATPSIVDTSPATIERGRYLALAGNCAGCHSVRGGAPYAGGLAIATPFGRIYSSNLTPDAATGLGEWSADHFWRAMHNGRSKDGHLLYPAFPYTSFTKISRADSDALYAYLRSLPPVVRANSAHTLRFPYSTQAALAVWRALFFEPGADVPVAGESAQWNRGAYLVNGLGHCIACHGPRNALGATQVQLGLSGSLIPGEHWYAPSLASPREAGVARWPAQDIVALLKTGIAPGASVMGPMADVVYRSTQYLHDDDLAAMAAYLQKLPASDAPVDEAPAPTTRRDAGTMERGARIYDQQCAYCHGDAGQGAAGAYPPLAGNRAVTMASPVNLIEVVRRGGFLPATEGNPRPYGMPPFGQVLDDDGIAQVLTYIRGAWGNDAPPVRRSDTLQR